MDRAGISSPVMAAAALVAAVALGSVGAQGEWRQEASLSACDAAGGDAFGGAVALGDDWLAVGAPGRDDAGAGSGAVYLFHWQGQTWCEHTKLISPDAAAGDEFGITVALDGQRLLVGAWGDDSGAGSAYVFAWSGSAWQQQGRLIAPDRADGDNFGCSVSLSGDRAAIGAYADDDAGSSSGSAHVYHYDGASWTHQAKVTASDAEKGDYFGYAVGLSGGQLAVGAWGTDEVGKDSGSVYVFDANGGAWDEAARLVAADTSAQDWLGQKVSIGGEYVVASAPGADAGGAAYVFHRSAGLWTEQAKLTASGGAPDDAFGCSVSMGGEDVVIGASADGEAGGGAGAAYVFGRSGDGWSQAAKLLAEDAGVGERLGWSVAAADGRVVAGAVGDCGAGQDAGRAVVFAEVRQTTWQRPPGSPGAWCDANNWSAGVPQAGVDATIGNDGTAEILGRQASAAALCVGASAGGTLALADAALELGDLRIAGGGTVQADADSAIALAGHFDNRATEAGPFDLSQAVLAFRAAEKDDEVYLLEVAGADRLAAPAGWQDNFALGTLLIEAGAVVRLVDAFDNGQDGNGDEALYVGELTIEPGGRIDLNGCPLYYGGPGEPKKLFYGDADLDGEVDWRDYVALKRSFGSTEGAGWADGDTDGDGDVDFLDYAALRENFGRSTVAEAAGAAAVPEPSALALLACGVGLIAPARLRRRRWRRSPAAW